MSQAPQRDDARPDTRVILAIIGGIVLLLTIVFSITITRHHGTYRGYRTETLGEEDQDAPWQRRAFGVEECAAYVIDWTMECPGIAPWCQAEVAVVMESCLASQDRAAYCSAVGDTILSTRFGYDACKAARIERFGPHDGCQDRETESDRYACRHFKKYCAGAYRAIASHCLGASSESASTR